jgi:hypothetical protein
MLDAPVPSYRVGHVRRTVIKNISELQFGAVTPLSMKAPIKKFKRKRDPGMSFGELVQRLKQPESEEPEPKAAGAKKTVSQKRRANSEEVAPGEVTRCGLTDGRLP